MSSNPFSDQQLFMTLCGQTTDRFDSEQASLYEALIDEEFIEWKSAEEGSIDDIDACLDLIVVVIGYMLSHGWPAEQLWNEVIRSNMSKIDPDTGRVEKRADGKVLKPPTFSPPDLARVLASHQ